MKEFDNVWQNIQRNLKAGMEIRNWTVKNGYFGDPIAIISVISKLIIVNTPKAKHYQPVPKEDFEKVWQVWEGYNAEQVTRKEITELTRYSKYIISILHWCETD